MVSGKCLCGAVQFEIDGDLGETRLCYCSFCRAANGTAFSANIRVPLSRYRLIAGGDCISEFEASPGAFRAFCKHCGSPVHSRVVRDSDTIRIRLGTLSKEATAIVTAHVWVRSKPDWYRIEGDLPQYERGIDGPRMKIDTR